MLFYVIVITIVIFVPSSSSVSQQVFLYQGKKSNTIKTSEKKKCWKIKDFKM